MAPTLPPPAFVTSVVAIPARTAAPPPSFWFPKTFAEFVLGADRPALIPSKYHRGGTPPRRRRGLRSAVLPPSLRVSQILGTTIRLPRHASSW